MRGAFLGLVAASLSASSARAQVSDTPNEAGANDAGDRYELTAYSETYVELFRRSLLPGPNGSLVSTSTVAPLYEYIGVRASNLDTAWRRDALDVEVAAWGRAFVGARAGEQRLDGDIQAANARYRHGPFSVRIGRQHVAGGAARFARFDGLAAEAELGAGFDALAYAGWTVLPRWNERVRYSHLGAPPDSVLRQATALGTAEREDFWLAGARIGWAASEQRAGLSFHEQRETGGLARRNLGFDGRTPLLSEASLGGSALFDLDRQGLTDARAWLDLRPHQDTDVSFAYQHSEPALYLSQQSVLSVFSSAAYDEAGGSASFRASRALTLDGAGFVQSYGGDGSGARAELAFRCFPDAARSTFVRVAYARVQAPDNGYHALRSSLSRRLALRLRGTLEFYAYLYDEAIRSYRSSSVYAGTLAFEPIAQLDVLWGASLAHSPYANLDLQTQLRVSYTFDASARRVAR